MRRWLQWMLLLALVGGCGISMDPTPQNDGGAGLPDGSAAPDAPAPGADGAPVEDAAPPLPDGGGEDAGLGDGGLGDGGVVDGGAGLPSDAGGGVDAA